MSDVTPPPESRPPEAAESGPQIGVDEWVARREGRLATPTTVAGHAQQQLARVPQWVLLAGFVAFVALIPAVTSDEYVLRVTADTMLYVLLAMGLNVAVGWAGLLDLGYIAFYGFAAYLFAELSSPHYGLHWPTWASVPIVIVATIILGFLLALPTRRLTGDYLAIVTLFFGVIFVTFVTQGYRWDWLGFGATHDITGGPNGLTQIDPWRIFGHDLTRVRDYIWVKVAGFLIVALVLAFANHSRTGRAWRSLRDDALAAEAMSMPVNKLMLLAVAVGAGVAGFAGAINGALLPGRLPLVVRLRDPDHRLRDGDSRWRGESSGRRRRRDPDQRAPRGACATPITLAGSSTCSSSASSWRRSGPGACSRPCSAGSSRSVSSCTRSSAPSGPAGPPGRSRPESSSSRRTAGSRWLLRHWLVLPKNTYEVADYQIGNVAFVDAHRPRPRADRRPGLVAIRAARPDDLDSPRSSGRRASIEESPTTRPLLLGVILIVLMAVRPQGLFGTPRVEIV